jgi:tetratricopeptide (TPR) repeat protein
MACSLLSPVVMAGGGPETTLVVVNGRSPLSKRIANEYVHLRGIPPEHVVWLEDAPAFGAIPIKVFRKKIWTPIREFLQTHGLEQEIDVIAYSADFPHSVNFSSDLKGKQIPRNKLLGSRASLTSLTYFARRVEVGDLGYLGKNHYFADFAGPRIERGLEEFPISGPRLSEKEILGLSNEAKSALGRKDYAAALDAYRKIRNSHPANPRAWYDLSRTLAAAGRPDEALDALRSAVDRGWSHSLLTVRDRHLKSLYSDPRFQALQERMETAYGPFQLPHGFRNHYVWSSSDLARWEADDDLDRYYLSTMLAYTGIRGNSLPEVLDYLAAAAESDGSRPEGTVYLMENSNIRSQTRQPLFKATVGELARRGRKAEILSKGKNKGKDQQNGIVPINKGDVIGAVVGFTDYKWGASGSRLLPGAIAESLTSYGGDFNNGSQTKLTEFLRHGAAGSSGAVEEPFALQEKFPVPLLHAYYADGCSLAESFYQSLVAPFQLIIVGDPLTRPFARLAEVKLNAPDPTRPWSGKVTIVPDVQADPTKGIRKVELWIDGQFVAEAPMGKPIYWDTRKAADGYHELRLVAIEESVIETRSAARFHINVANGKSRVQIDNVTRGVSYGDEVVVFGKAVGADSVAIYSGYRKLGETTVRDGRWRLVIDSTDLGSGPVSLQARTSSNGTFTQSAPVEIMVGDPVRIGPLADLRSPVAGLKATVRLRNGETFSQTAESVEGLLKDLHKRKLKPDYVRFEGHFEIDSPGFYQLLVVGKGVARISVDDQAVLETQKVKRWREGFLPLGLDAGWHKLQFDLEKPRRGSSLKIMLAGQEVTQELSGRNLFYEEGMAVNPPP